MQESEPKIQNDEINIYEMWSTVVKRKFVILITPLIAALSAAIYAWTTPPIYSGEVLLEIGEVVNVNEGMNNNGSTNIFYLDNINTLKEITAQISDLKVEVPSGVANMLRITTEKTEKTEIMSQLNSTVQFIIQRHAEKAKLYQNAHTKITMTQIIGEIHIKTNPIKPKKGLIITVALISGLIMGIFLAFFLEFIGTRRNR
ncbi:MAG: Wzz/FepE/Etk N-terminal domain-containing protein [Sulfuricurvum sp.]|uniref:Wzz/FepE/Etk N-terminal domain-containing protein n=1 Tax=Sulfuricurvum sp. TaxID=2025608 RepID=UPI0027348E1B|nr:Wzz/FepE/Etk N-terminal domain-containing protein [Sulfuricurvum sp.]MDP2850900.1 Wzz/FepE/Etk N-terminal domain-containing protein [Sulfuricurvum sp.]